MDILNFIFRIGVVLAVYNFLWWLIMSGITILRGGRPSHLFEVYFIKAIRYGFLADVIFLFSIQQAEGGNPINDLLIAGLILLIYFVGKVQKKQRRQSFFSVHSQTNIGNINEILKKLKPVFDMRFEILVIVLSLGLFTGFYFAQHLAYNPISNWFLDSILNIEDTPVFGFIFKVIGFFFLLSVLLKILNGMLAVLFGRRNATQNFDNGNDEDEFDDFKEIK